MCFRFKKKGGGVFERAGRAPPDVKWLDPDK